MGKACRVKQRTQTHRKRRVFPGNKKKINDVNNNVNTNNPDVNNVNILSNTPTHDAPTTPTKTVSHSKVQDIVSGTPKSIDSINGYRLIDVHILDSVISAFKCPGCTEQLLTLKEQLEKKKGLASSLEIICSRCGYNDNFYTSRTLPYEGKGGKSFDVNARIIYAMRACGQGHAGVEKFTTLMDMPKPMTKNNYNKVVKKLVTATETVAKETMSDAIEELRSASSVSPDSVMDIAISQDGTWQRRGHSSLNGCVAAVSMDNGKVVDIEPMSRYCRGCSDMEETRMKDPAKYDSWKESHVCNFNYKGSAGGMETEGAKRIFSRSLKRHKVRYTELYGDGDSKSHETVKKTYLGIIVRKRQCVGHVQKRVGNRCIKLKKRIKGLGGRGKLTKRAIDRLQNYYGIAIRSNSNNLPAMQKAVRASLFHVASSETNNYHNAYCPPGKDSWCKFQKDKAAGTSTHKHGPGLPLSVIQHVKPIFENLSSDKLLEECLHGKTQNQNEAFNGTIWERIPKTKYVSLSQLKFGVYDAVANFNIGKKASVLIYEKMCMLPGGHMLKGCRTANKRRLFHSGYKNLASSKKRRKIIRGKKKSSDDTNKENEGTVYKPGEFE